MPWNRLVTEAKWTLSDFAHAMLLPAAILAAIFFLVGR